MTNKSKTKIKNIIATYGGTLLSAILAITIIICSMSMCSGTSNKDNIIDTVTTSQTETENPSDTEPKISMGKRRAISVGNRNALNRANYYLNIASFSRDGLIKQLEYEGFTTEDATYAVNNCGADWYEQAAKMATEYINGSSFSYIGLVNELKHDGFTVEQAEHGANAVGLVYVEIM